MKLIAQKMWKKIDFEVKYSKTPIYRAPIYRVPRFTGPNLLPPKFSLDHMPELVNT